jgi:WD40 repeat protein
VRQLHGHTAWVSKLVFSKDGRRLVSSATDQTIRFWDTASWTETKVLRGHSDEIHGLALSETIHLVASASKDGDLMLWNVDEHGAADGYTRLPEGLGDSQVLPLDHSRVLLLPDGRPPELADLGGDAPPIPLTGIAESNQVLGGFGTNLICHWDGTNQILIRELRGTEFTNRGAIMLDSGKRPGRVAGNLEGRLLAWSEPSSSNSVFVVNLATPDRRVELKVDVPGVEPFLFSDDGTFLVTVQHYEDRGDSYMRFVRAWNIKTGRIVASIDKPIQGAVLAGGGRVLVVVHADSNAHETVFYDLADPERAPRRVPGRHISSGLAVSPDGRLVASTTEWGLVQWFDPLKGELIEAVRGHLNGAFGIRFSPDGRRLISATGGRDTVKLWDVGTRQELLALSGSPGPLCYEARWTPDGDTILAGAPWHSWRAPSWEEIAAAEAKDKAEGKQP